MKTFKPNISIKLVVLCAIFLFSGQAYALLIDPATTAIALSGNETGQSQIDAVLDAAFDPDLVELYKMDVGGPESGPLQGSYETTFNNTPSDPADADIVYVGGDIVGPDAYLLVKDGNQTPAWYLFYLTGLGWDGMDTLDLNNFWPNQGAISHVTLYGIQSVPEPATAFLVGLGLIGIVAIGKKRIFKK